MAPSTPERRVPRLPQSFRSIISDIYLLPPESWSEARDPESELRLRIALFEKQLRDGCGDDSCRMPTCRTFQERHVLRPYRPLTILSIQATATMLASDFSPLRKLCRKLYRDHVIHEAAIDVLATSRSVPKSSLDQSSFMQVLFSTKAAKRLLETPLSRSGLREELRYPYELRRVTHRATDFLWRALEPSQDASTRIVARDIALLSSWETFSDPIALVASFRDPISSIESLMGNDIENDWEKTSIRSAHEAWIDDGSYALSHLHPLQMLKTMSRWASWNANVVLQSLSNGIQSLHATLVDMEDWESAKPALHAALKIPPAHDLPTKAELLAHAVILGAYAIQAYVHSQIETQGCQSSLLRLENFDMREESLHLVRTMLLVLQKKSQMTKDAMLENEAHELVMNHFERVETHEWSFENKSVYRNCGSLVEPLLLYLSAVIKDGRYQNNQVKRGSDEYMALKAFETLVYSSWNVYFKSLRTQMSYVDKSALHAPDLSERMTDRDLVESWISQSDGQLSLLEFPFLFANPAHSAQRQLAIRSFRGIAFNRMWRVVRASQLTSRLTQQNFVLIQHRLHATAINELHNLFHYDHPRGIRNLITFCLELEVSRENLLDDAFNQLWMREHRQLLLPLKVRLRGASEIGQDFGGVSQEFFTTTAREIFDPAKALFKLEGPREHAWFDPACREPSYRFGILGLIFALAIHNGFTIPVNFPLYFYRLILDPNHSFLRDRVPKNFGDESLRQTLLAHRALDSIRDAWPDVESSLAYLLQYDGNVEEDLAIDATFTVDAHGKAIHVPVIPRIEEFDLSTALVTEFPPAPAVTASNRAEYVTNYVHFLLHVQSAQAIAAFVAAFHMHTPRHMLSFLSPSALKTLTEGHTLPTVDQLKSVATLDGYVPSDTVLEYFWAELEKFDDSEMRKFLEFVTATDRVPVNGWQKMEFKIQKNGSGDRSLPSSSTCFGILLLPSYSSQEILGERLRFAMREGVGFGLR